jgi:spore germination protein GerM
MAVGLVLLVAVFVGTALWMSRPVSAPALVYFTQWDAARQSVRLEPALRTVRGRGRAEFVRQAVAHLLAGPAPDEAGQGFVTEIPKGTRLLGVEIVGQTARVDLSAEFERGGGSASMLARLYQVVYTATHFAGVEDVRVLIDGQARESLGGEGVLINTPLRRPPTPPKF